MTIMIYGYVDAYASCWATPLMPLQAVTRDGAKFSSKKAHLFCWVCQLPEWPGKLPLKTCRALSCGCVSHSFHASTAVGALPLCARWTRCTSNRCSSVHIKPNASTAHETSLHRRADHVVTKLAVLVAPLGHPNGLAPALTRVATVGTELLFDAHELVVLRVAVGAARCPRLDLTGAQAHRDVSNGGILGLPRAMRAHDAPAVLLAELHGVDGLGHRTDLVHLEEESVARLIGDRRLHALNVGHGEIVAHHLGRHPDLARHLRPRRPIVLV